MFSRSDAAGAAMNPLSFMNMDSWKRRLRETYSNTVRMFLIHRRVDVLQERPRFQA